MVALLAGLHASPGAWPGQPIDDAARAWVQAHRARALESPMRFVSDRARVVLVAGGALALVAGSAGRAFVLEAAIALGPANAAVEAFKWCVNRARPDGDRSRRNSSFPSSHAANAVALAAVVTRRWRRWWPAAWLAAAIVAYSRLFLDRHWLSDVVAGALLALAAAALAAVVMRRIETPRPASDGA